MKFDYSLKFSGHDLIVEIGDRACGHQLAKLISILDWLCRAIRAPCQNPSSDGFYLSLSSHQTSLSNRNSRPTVGQGLSSFDLSLSSTLLSEPLSELQHNCWQKLFLSCFVLDDEDTEQVEAIGEGLELSFNLMVSLAAVEYPIVIYGGVVLAGYHTALIPIRLEPAYVQFHLEIREDGQINPFDLDYSQRVQVLDWAQFNSMRCFVGWCESAHIKLGTSSLPITVTYSEARVKERSLQLSGVSTGFQLVSASPIQAGVNGQANFSFLSHRLRFQPTLDYTKMLYDTAKDVVLISDVHSRRSWLVPKLSLMLHMAHVWVAENNPPSDTNMDTIPFAEPHDDGSTVVKTLEGQGDLVICGQGNDSFKLRRLLLGISINLLASVNCKAKSTGKSLYGFEFMDLVMEPGRGSPMKEFKIKTDQSWLALANLADAVIICSKLGEAIAPAHGCCRSNAECNTLPCGQDYLAAHLSCLDRFRSRAGRQSFSLDEPSQVPLSHRKIDWRVSGNPFEVCDHESQSTDTCWRGTNMLQNVDQETVLRFMRSTQDHSAIANSKRLGTKGAVVFGKNGGL